MRLFIAIQPNKSVRAALRAIQNELRRRGVEGNYTRMENLHLTLAFIGEYPDADAVKDALQGLCFDPFPVWTEGFGSFGDLWWTGLGSNGELETLDRRLRHLLADSEIPFDRKSFRPHITLVRQPRFRTDPHLESLLIPVAEMTVDKVSLMLSTRGKNGMIYTELGSVSG